MNKHTSTPIHTLPPDTCLCSKYVIRGILGEGGFGITYDGYRTSDGMRVAIKEYFPHQIALRTEQDGVLFMQPFPEKYAETYERGRQRFLNEAGTLHSLQHLESIVSIYDSFEENGTAYIIMEYIDGPTLGQFVRENGALSFPELLHLADPLIRALSEVHRQGIIHRDISPDNIILGLDNKLHLIDFGAVTRDNPDGGKNTVILKAGYAPPEQYISNGSLGAWVDVYALCATMYYALTAKAPCEAMHRLDSETDESLPGLEHLLTRQRAAIEKGLQLRSANRFHDMEELHDALTAVEEVENAKTHLGSTLSKQEIRKIAHIFRPRSEKVYWGIATAFLFLLLGLGVFALLQLSNRHTGANDSIPVSVSPSPKAATSTPDTLLKMIDVSDLTLKNGKQSLRKLDKTIQIKTTSRYSDTIPAGRIIRQSIAPDTSFSKGAVSSILLTVSKGRKPAKSKATKQPAATPKPSAAKKPSTTSPSSSSEQEKSRKKKDYDVKGSNDYTTIPLE